MLAGKIKEKLKNVEFLSSLSENVRSLFFLDIFSFPPAINFINLW